MISWMALSGLEVSGFFYGDRLFEQRFERSFTCKHFDDVTESLVP